MFGVAKVAHLEQRARPGIVQQQIFKLQVAVGYTSRVAVLQSEDELLEQPASLALGQLAPGPALQVRMKISTLGILHRNAQMVRGEQHFVQTDDQRVAQAAMVHDFAFDVGAVGPHQVASWQHLDGDLYGRGGIADVQRLDNHPKRAAADDADLRKFAAKVLDFAK